ncbi:hypothetical protein NDU88_006247 [Pleurodeles waltl]|uniref:Uncharacterized protein n=1 Tax=Pleurodeles waltl TaxID=8319 RepID=A0AAV7X359_PLEWA|nr:hypothetical protein NDU88_006247 [Pleurodeles waltl]
MALSILGLLLRLESRPLSSHLRKEGLRVCVLNVHRTEAGSRRVRACSSARGPLRPRGFRPGTARTPLGRQAAEAQGPLTPSSAKPREIPEMSDFHKRGRARKKCR